jgi:serine/threonine-protein kinase
MYSRKALALDDSLAEAHASLAWATFIYDWNWSTAAREFGRAMDVDPRYASAHQWYSFFLASQGRLDDALVEAHTALELDPASVPVRRSLAHIYFYARRYDHAVHHIERAMEQDPTAGENHRLLGLFLAAQGDLDDATRVLRDSLELPDAGVYPLATLGYALGLGGHIDEARAILADITRRASVGYISPVSFAMIYVGLRDWNNLFAAMDQMYEQRRGWLVYLNVNPVLDPLRDDPRLRALVARMRLP